MLRFILAVVAVCFTALIARSQTHEQLSPTEMKQKTIVTEPLTTYKGFVRAGLLTQFNVVDKLFMSDGTRQSLGGDAWATLWTTNLDVQYGISDRLQVEVVVPFVVDKLTLSNKFEFPFGPKDTVSIWDQSSKGIGDMRISAGYQIIPEDANDLKLTSLALFTNLTIPTAEKNPTNADPTNPRVYERPAGYGEFVLNGLLRYRIVSYPFAYNAILSYSHHFPGQKLLSPTDTEETPFQSGGSLYAAGAVNLMLNDWIAVKNYVEFFASGKDEVGGVMEEHNKWLVQYAPGLSFQLKQFRVEQWVSLPIAGKLNGADPGYSMLLMYVF